MRSDGYLTPPREFLGEVGHHPAPLSPTTSRGPLGTGSLCWEFLFPLVEKSCVRVPFYLPSVSFSLPVAVSNSAPHPAGRGSVACQKEGILLPVVHHLPFLLAAPTAFMTAPAAVMPIPRTTVISPPAMQLGRLLVVHMGRKALWR